MVDVKNDLLRLFVGKNAHEFLLKYLWGRLKFTMWVAPMYMGIVAWQLANLTKADATTSLVAVLTFLGFLETFNMLSFRLVFMIPWLFKRFDFLFMFMSMTVMTLELLFFLPLQNFILYSLLVYPVFMLFIATDIDAGMLILRFRRLFLINTSLTMIVCLVLSHGGLVASATYIYIHINTTNTSLQFELETTTSAMGPHRSADFTFDVHYFSEVRIVLFMVFLLKILGRSTESCMLLDTPATIDFENESNKRLMTETSAARKQRKMWGYFDRHHEKLDLSERSKRVLSDLDDEDEIVIYCPSSRGLSFCVGPENSVAHVMICLSFLDALVRNILAEGAWMMVVLTVVAWTLSFLGLIGILGPSWTLACLFCALDAVIKLLGMNTNILSLVISQFNFLFPFVVMIMAVALGIYHNDGDIPFYGTFLVSLLLYTTANGLLWDASEYMGLVTVRPSLYRTCCLLISCCAVGAWCCSTFLSGAVSSGKRIKYQFIRSEYDLSVESVIFRFSSTLLLFLARYATMSHLFPNRCLVYYFHYHRTEKSKEEFSSFYVDRALQPVKVANSKDVGGHHLLRRLSSIPNSFLKQNREVYPLQGRALDADDDD